MSKQGVLANLDWTLIFIYLFLVFVGFFNIYAAVYNGEPNSFFDFNTRYGKQLVWIGAAFLIAIFVLVFDPKFFSQASYIIYGVFIVMLIAVLAIGSVTKGAKSWFGIGDFGIQPSEFAKAATGLALASLLSRINIKEDMKSKILAISVVVLPILLVLLQNDTGSALVFLSLVFVLFREGLSTYVLIFGAILIVLFVLALVINPYILVAIFFAMTIIAWMVVRRRRTKKKAKFKYFFYTFIFCSLFVMSVEYAFDHVLESHQKDRIEVLLGKKEDKKGIGYNVNQSKIAIGSGGIIGKGYLKGTQTKYNFVPEQDTDFIFCTIGEEWGFVGSALVVCAFVWLCVRIIKKAEQQRSAFARIYGYCVASIIFFHFFINIGMTIGLLPVIGIPLPFISYGGSSLWAFTFLLFVFIHLDASAK
jgi:rod shape determining protein RodA